MYVQYALCYSRVSNGAAEVFRVLMQKNQLTDRNSDSGFVKSSTVAEGNKALVIALSLKAAKYTSYTALISAGRAGSTTKPIAKVA